MNSLLYTFTALLGAACLALPAFSAPAAALPPTSGIRMTGMRGMKPSRSGTGP